MSEFWASAFTYYFPFILKKNIFKYKIFYIENIFCETFSLYNIFPCLIVYTKML